MTRDDLETELDRVDNSVAVECMDNSAFYDLAHKLNDRANALQIRVNDMEEGSVIIESRGNPPSEIIIIILQDGIEMGRE